MPICFPSVLTKQIILGISGIRISLVSILQSHNLVGGWATQLKNMLVKLDHFCKDWVEHKKYIWNHHLDLHDSPGACYDCFFVARLPAQTNSPRYLILEETSNNGRRDVSFFLGCLFGFKGNHLDFVCTTTFLDFSREKKISKKWVCLKKMCLSKSPQNPYPNQKRFQFGWFHKGVLSRLHSSYPEDFEPSFLGGSQRNHLTRWTPSVAML